MRTLTSSYGVRWSAANTSSWAGYTGWRARSSSTNCCSSGQYGLANSARRIGFQSVRSAIGRTVEAASDEQMFALSHPAA